ncbi:MAG: hypothetical protein ACI9JN_002187 [Bacteroidia bacterium]|jgi:hypothetical protein
MNKKYILSFFLLFVALGSSASEKDTSYQDSIRNIEFQLEGLSHNIINGVDVQERVTSCYYFVQTLKKALQVPTSFDYDFTLLKTVSILKPKDEAFRIFTWNLLLDSGRYMYFGALQMNNDDSLVLYGLYDSSDNVRDPEFQTVDNRHWMGALYYQIHDYKYKGKMHYILFGWDGEDHLVNKKIIDVLYFDEDNKPMFGLPIFVNQEDEYKYRIIHTFADQATIISRYNAEENSIVFNHLTPFHPMQKGMFQYYVPDGTYDYMEFSKGFWLRKDLLFKGLDEHKHDLRKTNDVQEPEAPKDFKKQKKKAKRKNRKAF